MIRWKVAGITATIVIILTIPAYVFKVTYVQPPRTGSESEREAAFVGSKKCGECHQPEYDKWLGSHHDLAMDQANEISVLGDFNNAEFEHFGVMSSFYRKGGRFFVYTQGPDGQMEEFEISHTFGWYPLQQYLVPFPGGRLQCLPLAWDVKKRKWYHLYPDEPLDPKDWLYWTNAGQNWNGMCAECHSTNLRKNYHPKTDTYQTTWSDIDVGCEACHGPGSRHVEWSEMPEMARPQVEDYELAVQTAGLDARDLVELCAPCHSRRAALGDYSHAEPDLLDSLLPSLLTGALYFPDGQILEEVYVYGSFTQSKMYRREVRCNDCHDAHSVKLVKEGNGLCLQCHRAGEYDTKSHHFHRKKGEEGDPIKTADGQVLFDVGTGAECVQCHMPGRYYMGIDYRPDHSFRTPRPDLTVKLDTPNACNRCHLDQTAQWSDEYMTQWYGPGRRPHYGTIIAAGREGLREARKELIQLAGDTLYPVIVRATALLLLNGYPPGRDIDQAIEIALMDEESLIRHTAVNHMRLPGSKKQLTLLASMLYDSVKAVRMEAARRLSESSWEQLDLDQKRAFSGALNEFQQAMEYSADFASGRYNLGNLYVALNRPEEAIQNYRDAIKIDDMFYAAKVNLAMLYNQLGEKGKAEVLLRAVVKAHPQLHEVQYSLGLLLAEQKQYGEAARYLSSAARGMPNRARVHYNLGLLLEYLRRDPEAETALLRALEIEPDNMDYLYAVAHYYLEREEYHRAKAMAERMISKHPSNQIGHELLAVINRRLQDHGS